VSTSLPPLFFFLGLNGVCVFDFFVVKKKSKSKSKSKTFGDGG